MSEETKTEDSFLRFTSTNTDMDEFKHIKFAQQPKKSKYFRVPFPVEILQNKYFLANRIETI